MPAKFLAALLRPFSTLNQAYSRRNNEEGNRVRIVERSLALLAAVCVVSGCSGSAGDPAPAIMADAIYYGGPILTMNDAAPRAGALAVKDGKIAAIGTLQDVERLAGPQTRSVDLQGRTMLPGFVDSHGHVYMIGVQAASANLLPPPDGEGKDIGSLQQRLRDWDLRAAPPLARYGWIVGFGYDDSELTERRHPTRVDLDRVSKDKPVIIIHQSGHLGVVNSKALALAGLTASTPDPEGGVIRRRAGSREPDGVLEELAFFSALLKLVGQFDADTNVELVRQGAMLVARYGYTTAQEGRITGKPTLDAFVEAAEKGSLPVDVVAYIDVLAARELIAPPWLAREYTGRFRVGGGKLTIDGSPQGKTAWLTKPYAVPPPGRPPTYAGYPVASRQQVMDAVDHAFAQKYQLLTHANGDAASDLLIEAVRAAERKHGGKDLRPVLIHGQVLREEQVDALKDLGIFPSLFPMHTFYWGDWHRASVLGPARAENISPTGWVLARGMRFGTHHDAPVALPDSMRVLASTVTRRTRSGRVLGPAHRVEPMVALKAMTIWPAWQHFEDATKGSLEVGKLADFAILSANPAAIDPLEIENVKVLETIKEGRSIYKR